MTTEHGFARNLKAIRRGIKEVLRAGAPALLDERYASVLSGDCDYANNALHRARNARLVKLTGKEVLGLVDWPAMVKRKVFWVCLLVPLYALTWVGGWISHAHQLQEQAESGYVWAQRENQMLELEAHYTGFKTHPIKLREGGPISHVWWCVPLLPSVLLADSEYSVGQGDGGERVTVIFYYGLGSIEILKLWRRME